MPDKFRAVVAGHICLDVIPSLDHLPEGKFSSLFLPGHIISTGPATFSTGGPVSNTGLALFRLGVPARLIAKVGADPFGKIVRGLVESFDPALVGGLVSAPDQSTSYSVIVSPPGIDRIFLHCPGANDTFCADDIDYTLAAEAGLFHFGYPPIMRRMYQDGGTELAEVFRRAKATGVTTSLDMAFPDPSSEGGQVDWRAILKAALPYVDIFLPSIEELLFMLRRDNYDLLLQCATQGDILSEITPGLLSSLAQELMGMGAKIVVIKMGYRGSYLRTAGREVLAGMGRAVPSCPQAWANQELWAPCFKVNVVGTTGSGDATIAGFLSALLRDFTPRQAITAAVAVGACNVEAADALSGIRPWDETSARVKSGWERLDACVQAAGWDWSEVDQVWVGPTLNKAGC